MDSILLVEDRAELREMLQRALQRFGYEVVAASGLSAAQDSLRHRRFSAVLTDLKLPSGSGMDVLRAAVENDPEVPVVIMTAYGSIAEAVAAMRDGAYDFIQKPIDLDHLRRLLARAIERQQLLRENLVLKEEYARRFGFPRILGDHPSMQTAAREMQRIAPADSTVLLLGESGTGKELFARAIHQLSGRAARPFVAINCAAIPEPLVENELFGHERGAFTGANARKPGKFELAHGGTIFLDEIGELPLTIQGKLLRVLEELVVERLGGAAPIPVDVRVIAATNRDLQAAAEAGEFRRDLYYRLAVFPIQIPPLRERGDDIRLIAEHFLERFRHELKKPRLGFTAEAMAVLAAHSWPGNVRELQNCVERAAILNDAEITAEALNLGRRGAARAAAAPGAPAPNASTAGASPLRPGFAPQGGDPQATPAPATDNPERAELEAVLRECKWNKSAAAQRLGISYKSLLNKIHAHQLD